MTMLAEPPFPGVSEPFGDSGTSLWNFHKLPGLVRLEDRQRHGQHRATIFAVTNRHGLPSIASRKTAISPSKCASGPAASVDLPWTTVFHLERTGIVW